MLLSDLQDKDVIDVSTGLKIGNIIDIKVNEDGLMEVGEININKIAQEEGTRIIFDSGNAFEE